VFIHLGGDKVIRSSELIGIFDMTMEQSSKITKQFITHAKQVNRVEVIGEEETKSLVVTTTKIYYSPISSSTIKKRTNHPL
jgi:hypothetical protein